MKNTKRILALIAAGILVLLYISTLVFAMMDSEWAYSMFQISIFSTVAVPVLLYAMILVYKRLKVKNQELFSDSINTVIFDVGNVLVNYDWKSYVKSFDFPEELNQLAASAMFENPLWEEADRGVMTPQQLEDGFAANAPQYADEMRMLFRRAEGTVTVYPYAREWVRELKNRGMKVYILSNYASQMFERTKKQMDFLPLVDGAIFSFQCHKIKPEQEIYQELIKKYQINPAKAVFIDDRSVNVEGAREAGLKALQFTSYKDTKSALERMLQPGL